jgi:RNA polymerase sigma-70 factor (ECF subfamily)
LAVGLSLAASTILVLREYEDLSFTAMAQVIGCSIGTVESRLFRARARFKEALERLHPELVPQVRVPTGGNRS